MISVPLTAGTATAPITVNGAQGVVFAVQVTYHPDVNSGGDSLAGLLFSALVLYSDGSQDAIVSDGDWSGLLVRAVAPLPNNWQAPTFDDASWAAASVLGLYGIAPWNTGVSIPDPSGEHPASLCGNNTPFLVPAAARKSRKLAYSTRQDVILSAT
ncbi:hypothetical protein HMN09_00809900 [Mycena chlorophos]|uniref:Uncharacterized protein n=1 Tax=Mycena chlorophos TaxID=658473 RepID=A0A8H6W5F7_MYCCL|nr:hypothetical protein HMN09_00809900 [Mycena chlorophos]